MIKYLVADRRYDYLETGSLVSIEENVANIVVPSEEEHFDMYPMDFEEFLFDRKIREAARRYEPTGDWTHSWNFVGGCTLTAEF